MKDQNKASDILSNLFKPEEPKNPHITVTANDEVIRPLTSLNNKDFIKIAENLYAESGNYDKVWEVSVMDGVPYIVSKESSLLYKSDDYSVKDAKQGVDVLKGEQFIDNIEISEYADKPAVVSILNDKINKVSFLPVSLVIESIRKEAQILSKKFINTASFTAEKKK